MILSSLIILVLFNKNKSILDYFSYEKTLDCFEGDKTILDDFTKDSI